MSEIPPEAIEIIPEILWFILALVFVLLFYKPIRDDLLPKLTSFSAGGVEINFNSVQESMDEALELAQKSPQWKVAVTPKQKQLRVSVWVVRLRRMRGCPNGEEP